MPKPTNQEFLTDLMDFSNHGALAEVFVMDAVHKVAHYVANTPIEKLREQFGENGFFSADAWHGVATEIAKKFDERLAS